MASDGTINQNSKSVKDATAETPKSQLVGAEQVSPKPRTETK